MVNQLLSQDAQNRALRSGIQALILEVLYSVVPVLYDALSNDDVVWDVHFLESLARIAGMAVLAYLMRRHADGSKIPTPLPPSAQTPPSTTDPLP